MAVPTCELDTKACRLSLTHVFYTIPLFLGHGSCLEHTGSAGLIGSDCGHLLAIRPARECVLGYLDTMKV